MIPTSTYGVRNTMCGMIDVKFGIPTVFPTLEPKGTIAVQLEFSGRYLRFERGNRSNRLEPVRTMREKAREILSQLKTLIPVGHY